MAKKVRRKPGKNALEFLRARRLLIMKMYRKVDVAAASSGLLDPPYPFFYDVLGRAAAIKFRAVVEEAKRFWGLDEIEDALRAMNVDPYFRPWNGLEYDAFCRNEPIPEIAKS